MWNMMHEAHKLGKLAPIKRCNQPACLKLIITYCWNTFLSSNTILQRPVESEQSQKRMNKNSLGEWMGKTWRRRSVLFWFGERPIWGTLIEGGGCYWPMGREQWPKAKAVCFLCWAMLLLSNDMAYTLLGISLYIYTNIPIYEIYKIYVCIYTYIQDRWNPCGPFVPKKVKRPLLQVLKFVKNISGVNLHRPLPWHAVQCEAILSAWCCLNTKEGIFLNGARIHKKGAGSRRGTFGSMIKNKKRTQN